jgi:Uma2 family endonuclease
LAEIGVLEPDSRSELLDGQIIDTPRITPLHASTVHHLGQLIGHISNHWLLIIHGEVVLDEYTQLQPDLMMVKPRSDSYCNQHPSPEDVFLLVEVADNSLDFDRIEKLPAYARAGVAEVWIVNLNEATIEVYREPNFTGYGSKNVLHAEKKATHKLSPTWNWILLNC